MISEKIRSASATSPKHTVYQKQRHSLPTLNCSVQNPLLFVLHPTKGLSFTSLPDLTMGRIEFTIQSLINPRERRIPIFIYGTCTTDVRIYRHLLQDYEIRDILYYQARKIRTQRDEGIQVNHPSFTSPIILYLKLSDGEMCQELRERIQAGRNNLKSPVSVTSSLKLPRPCFQTTRLIKHVPIHSRTPPE